MALPLKTRIERAKVGDKLVELRSSVDVDTIREQTDTSSNTNRAETSIIMQCCNPNQLLQADATSLYKQ